MHGKTSTEPQQTPTTTRTTAIDYHDVDLDVDSDSTGEVDRSEYEETIEANKNLPGVIVAVDGARAKMVVQVSAGQTARLELAAGADKVVLWHEATGGAEVFPEGDDGVNLTAPTGEPSTQWTFWIEAIAKHEHC